MRVSNNSITARLLQQVQESRARLAEVQEQTGSGRRVNRPSDDPTATGRIMTLDTDLELNEQYARNSNAALADLTVNEATIASLADVLQRARELAVQGANGALDGAARQQIALEVSQLVTQAIALGNTRSAGRYIFAGQKTDTQPFVPDNATNPTVVTYAGDSNGVAREVSQGDRLNTNVTGDRTFPGVIADLIAFRDHLRSNNASALQTDADAIGNRLDEALELRSEVGAKMNRVQTGISRLEDEHTMLLTLVSNEQDVDLAQSIVELQARETTLQAALGAAGRALNLSLLEFLR